MKSFNAIRENGQTLVGSSGPFPRKFGNCFSVVDESGKSYKILNFKIENIEELVRLKELSWPIKCEALSEHSAVINDGRIPDDWYQDHFCEVCTPLDLLPLPQRLQHLRDIQRGKREESANGIVIRVDPVVHKKKEINWKVEPTQDFEALHGDDVGAELSKILSEEIQKSVVQSYKGFVPGQTKITKEWQKQFETDEGYFYAPYLPLNKEE